MFNHLVESESHLGDIKRRSAFIFGTLVFYAVLFAVGGVLSIYAYNAHVESQSLEVQTFLAPVEITPVTQPARTAQPKAPASADNTRQVSERTAFIPPVANSTIAPDKVSATKSTVPELPPGLVRLGDRNVDANLPTGPGIPSGRPDGNSTNLADTKIEIKDTAPPPVKVVKPTPSAKPVYVGPISGKAISLPKPPYPPSAKTIGAQGPVTVQIVVDETGKVISTRAVSGHFMLRQAAEKAAYEARFKPTTLNGQPVKVSGTITFNFVLNH